MDGAEESSAVEEGAHLVLQCGAQSGRRRLGGYLDGKREKIERLLVEDAQLRGSRMVKEEGNGEADRVRKRLASYGGGPVGLARGVTTIGGGSIRSWTSKKRRGELLPRHPTRNTARLHGDHL